MLFRITGIDQFGKRIVYDLAYTEEDARRLADEAVQDLELVACELIRKPRL